VKQKTRRDEQNDDEEEEVERLDDGARLLRVEKAHAGVILVDNVMVAAVAASDSAASEPRQTVCRR
jgi:hypothetical protein